MKPNSRSNLGCGYAVCAAVGLAGLALIVSALGSREAEGSASAGVRAGFGLGVVALAFLMRRSLRRSHQRLSAEQLGREERPNEPWRWREDWKKGRLLPHGRAGAVGLTVMAIFWNAVTWPILLLVLPAELERGNRAAWLIGLFPLAGIWLIATAVRQVRGWRRYGRSVLLLSETPARPGGFLGGALHVPGRLEFLDDPVRSLRAIKCSANPRRRPRGAGRRPHDDDLDDSVVLWETERRLDPGRMTADQAGLDLPVLFPLPADVPETTPPGSGEPIVVVWLLRLAGKVRGPALSLEFEVPVFRTGEPVAVSSAQPAPVIAAYRPEIPEETLAAAGLAYERKGAEGWPVLRAPARRNRTPAMVSLLVAAGLGAGALALLFAGGDLPWVFSLVVGLFALLPLALGVSLFRSGGEVRFEAEALVLAPSGVKVPRADIAAVRVESRLSTNDIRYHTLFLDPPPESGKKPVEALRHVRGQSAAEAAAAVIRRWLRGER